MPFTATSIPGLVIFEPAVYLDDRGFFLNPIIGNCFMPIK